MNRSHCDNCDKVLTGGPFKSEPLQSKLLDGTDVAIEVILMHPVTKHRLELCAGCARRILDAAKPGANSGPPFIIPFGTRFFVAQQ